MKKTKIGYPHPLYVLPFDHRGSFQSKLFGIKGNPTEAETAEIASYKDIIYEGYKKALAQGISQKITAILVDEQFGSAILKDARSKGYSVCCPAEKSGQDEFDFQFGEEFGSHIAKFDVTFVKVLVRYNPEGDAEMNRRQAARLKRLSDYCTQNHRYFMFELLVPATPAQLEKCGGSTQTFDRDLRPGLMLKAMAELQNTGIEPDVWKIEGLETAEDCVKIAAQARNTPARQDVGCILLGRGENGEKVKQWLATAAAVPGFVGFAVGRTIFWDALKGVKDGKHSKEQASDMMAATFKSFCDLWESKQSQK